MNPTKLLKIIRQEVPISQHIGITHFNSPTVLETHNGLLLSVIKVEGHPYDTATNEVLNQLKQTWHRTLLLLDERFGIHVTLHRHRENIHLPGDFPDPFTQAFNANYHKQFQGRNVYMNDIYITLVYKGITEGKAAKSLLFFKSMSERVIKEARIHQRAAHIKQLQRVTQQLLISLATFKPRLLGLEDKSLGYSELLCFLSVIVNGGEQNHMRFTRFAPRINKTVEENCIDRQYPDGHIAQYLPTNRLFFGKHIQFQGNATSDTRYAAMLGIKRYGHETSSLMLDPLLQLDCEFISTNSFLLVPKDIAKQHIAKHQNKMHAVEDAATSQLMDLEIAKDEMESDRISMGYHHHALMLISDSQVSLEHAITRAVHCYSDAGMVAIKESLGQEPAFWAQIPTNTKYITRSSLISSENFVDFCPLHNDARGYRDGNHLGSAVSMVETVSRTPFFINLHARGNQHNPTTGHTVIIGGNGSGKTVTMAFLDAQLARYGGRSFLFDRNQGMEIYVRACGGYYAILSPDNPEQTCFNPFSLDDTPANRQFCRDWLAQLVMQDDETSVDDMLLAQLTECVHYAYDQLASTHRYLSNVVKLLPLDFPRWHRLRRWLRGNDERPDGEYAYLFDNQIDALLINRKMGFDMTHFLDREPPSVLAALTQYLFHRIELSLDGNLVSVFLDEAWQYLQNPLWQKKLSDWLPTLRKLNCHIVFATQSPKTIVASPMRHIILDNAATQIYFANPQAQAEHYVEGFNLTESEFSCIKENEASSRLFLYKQGRASTLCYLNLSEMHEALAVFSGNKRSIELMHEIRRECGNDPHDWLPKFYQRSATI